MMSKWCCVFVLQDFVSVQQLFEQYDETYRETKATAEAYKKHDSQSKLHLY